MATASTERIVPGQVIEDVENAAFLVTRLLNPGQWSRQCSMAIVNDTSYSLEQPQRYEDCGEVINVPLNIPPGHTGFIAAHSYFMALKGTAGVITFKIEGLEVNLQLLWCVPYTGRNYVSVNVREEIASLELFESMYRVELEELYKAKHTVYKKHFGHLRVDVYMSVENDAILVVQLQEM